MPTCVCVSAAAMDMIRTMAGKSMACGAMAIYYDLPCRHVPMNFLMWLVLPFRFRPALQYSIRTPLSIWTACYIRKDVSRYLSL